MQVMAIHEKDVIREYLKQHNPGNFVYQCGNLESPYWELCQWFGLYEGQKLLAIAFLGLKYDFPVLLATSYGERDDYQEELVLRLNKYRPKYIYTHLNIDTAARLVDETTRANVTKFYNMELCDISKAQHLAETYSEISSIPHKSTNSRSEGNYIIHQFSPADTQEISDFLKISHPDHLLEREFIDAGYFWGIRHNGKIVSLAGVATRSEDYSVVAIGNVTTHPDYRQQGLATITIATQIRHLSQHYRKIVLNVKQANTAALNCYHKLGFQIIGVFDEVIFEAK